MSKYNIITCKRKEVADLNINKALECPKCTGKEFIAKFETTYVYSYEIDTKNIKNTDRNESLPFLFDNRSRHGAKQYIECKKCGTQFPCEFTMDGKEVDFTIIQKAIRSEHVDKPHYWG